MNVFKTLVGLFTGDGFVKPVTELLTKKSEIKAAADKQRSEIEAALQTKKLEQIEKSGDYEQAWNLAQINNSGFKDELWTIILATPFVACFIPGLQSYVLEGFKIIETTPEWYRYFVGIAISAAFGYAQLNKAWKWWNAP
jgi:hypothetical protein